MPESHYLLTAALPAGRAVLQYIDLRRTADYLDFINLMAYDFSGSWTHRSGHHAQLYALSKDESSGASAVQYLVSQGFPSQKILLGIPLYGRSFLHAAGPGQKFKGVGGDNGTFDYNQLPRRGTKEVLDKKHIAAQCVGADGGFVTYDNPDTVKMKAAFCKSKSLGVMCLTVNCNKGYKVADSIRQGLFYWSGPLDAKDSSRSLIATGFRALHSS